MIIDGQCFGAVDPEAKNIGSNTDSTLFSCVALMLFHLLTRFLIGAVGTTTVPAHRIVGLLSELGRMPDQ